MYSLLPFLLIILSLGIIIVILIRRFPQLALLDIDSDQEVQEGKKKAEILKQNVERKAEKVKKERRKKLEPLIMKLKQLQLTFRKLVGRIEKMVFKKDRKKEIKKEVIPEKEEKKLSKKEEIENVLSRAKHLFEEESLEASEKKYIEAIRMDAKNTDAYRGLAEVYEAQGQLDEAKETLKFVLQLDPKDDKTMVHLAEIYTGQNKYEKAIEWYEQAILLNDIFAQRFAKLADLFLKIEQPGPALDSIERAVELEPQNPKYLDKFLEISIILGIKEKALKIYEKLRLVNPDNKKLEVWKEQIDELD